MEADTLEQFITKYNAVHRVSIWQDEELLNEIIAERMKGITYRSKSFLFKSHKQYTIKNLTTDEVVSAPTDLQALLASFPFL
jgi:hypothetical protein